MRHRIRTFAPFGLVLAILPILTGPLGCGADDQEFTFFVRDVEGDLPIAGIEIRAVGDDRPLGTTDGNGRCTVNVRSDGRTPLRFRLSLPEAEGAPPYELESVYEVEQATLSSGVKTIRLRRTTSTHSEAETLVILQVTSTPAGAEVLIDSLPQGDTPQILTLEPNIRLRITIRLAGFAPWEQDVVLEAGEQYVDVALQRLAEARAAVRITSVPSGAGIMLDGQPTGQVTPADLSDLHPGQHSVRMVKEGYQPYATEVELRGGGPRGAVGCVLVPTNAAPGSLQQTVRRAVAFSRAYQVSVYPGWAHVYIDGGSNDQNAMGNFRITLAAGVHHFHVVNENAGVSTTLEYAVAEGDQNNILILNYETGQVEARQ